VRAKGAAAGDGVKVRRAQAATPDFSDPSLYVNRELSWLAYDRRVLEEAEDKEAPLLERAKFMSIYSSLLDEFFMVRVSGLKRQAETGGTKLPPDGMSPEQQLAAIRRELVPDLQRHAAVWHKSLRPALADEGIDVVHWEDLQRGEQQRLRSYYRENVLPILTPLAFDPAHPFPHISNLSLNLAVVLEHEEHGERFARLKVPSELPRLLEVPVEGPSKTGRRQIRLVWLKEVVAANLRSLFPGMAVRAAYPFRVTRDADQEIRELEAGDLLDTVEEVVGRRFFGSVVRLQTAKGISRRVLSILARNLGLSPEDVYEVDGPLGYSAFHQVASIDRPDLKDPPISPVVPHALKHVHEPFAALRERDVLFYHPYDSFAPVVDLVRAAAGDPAVLAIKITLYRIDQHSPIVDALIEARESGTQVAALVELKARFDEEKNIAWARALEAAGVHVIYGVVGLKTHAKMCLIVRRERDRIVRYVHLSSGNYNTNTARLYADLALMTSDRSVGADVSDLFNSLTGYPGGSRYRRLLVAPWGLRDELIKRIAREIAAHRKTGDGRIVLKVNALVDDRVIRALYHASRAGVKVDLNVRGICCLRPGVRGVSENIRVTSIVGRFLEHGRIYYFRNGGQEEVYLGSADMMPRNFDHRVEIVFPVLDPRLKRRVVQDVMEVHLADNVKARQMRSDGTYARVAPGRGEPRINSQQRMLDQRVRRAPAQDGKPKRQRGKGERA
jgi:polyphosphate kinase